MKKTLKIFGMMLCIGATLFTTSCTKETMGETDTIYISSGVGYNDPNQQLIIGTWNVSLVRNENGSWGNAVLQFKDNGELIWDGENGSYSINKKHIDLSLPGVDYSGTIKELSATKMVLWVNLSLGAGYIIITGTKA